jgi:hypothetical protein
MRRYARRRCVRYGSRIDPRRPHGKELHIVGITGCAEQRRCSRCSGCSGDSRNIRGQGLRALDALPSGASGKRRTRGRSYLRNVIVHDPGSASVVAAIRMHRCVVVSDIRCARSGGRRCAPRVLDSSAGRLEILALQGVGDLVEHVLARRGPGRRRIGCRARSPCCRLGAAGATGGGRAARDDKQDHDGSRLRPSPPILSLGDSVAACGRLPENASSPPTGPTGPTESPAPG